MGQLMAFEILRGMTLTSIEGAEAGSDEIVFTASTGDRFRMCHYQNCCEWVSVNDVEGDLADLIGREIVLAEESTSGENPDGVAIDFQDSFTWTFYRIATEKGFVVIRWYGESNGYYSESVEFEKV